MSQTQEKPRSLQFLCEGLKLFRRSVGIVLLLIVLMLMLSYLRSLLLFKVESAMGGGYLIGSDFPSILSIIGGLYQRIPLAFPLRAALKALEIVTLIITGFFSLCETALVTARSLLILKRKDYSSASVYSILRPNAPRLIRIWLLLYIITISPGYYSELSAWINTGNAPTAVMLIVMGVLLILTLAAFVAAIIQQIAVCAVIEGENENPIYLSLSIIRRAFGAFIRLLLAYAGLIIAVMLPLELSTGRGLLPSVLYIAFSYAAMFLWITSVTSLYHRISYFAADDAEENEDEFFQNEAGESGGALRFRINPSLRFKEVGEFHGGLARVRRYGHPRKCGYIDASGQYAFKQEYKDAGDFHNGVAIVREGRYERFININGEPVIDAEYDQANIFREGLALVKLGTSWGFTGMDGKLRKVPYDDVYSFSEGLAAAYDGEVWMYIDKTLTPALRTEYDEIWSFCCGLAMVEKNNMLGFIDRAGAEVIPLRYDDASSFSEGLAAVAAWHNGTLLWGYLRSDGTEAIPQRFEGAAPFSEGRAAVCCEGRYGHIIATPLDNRHIK